MLYVLWSNHMSFGQHVYATSCQQFCVAERAIHVANECSRGHEPWSGRSGVCGHWFCDNRSCDTASEYSSSNYFSRCSHRTVSCPGAIAKCSCSTCGFFGAHATSTGANSFPVCGSHCPSFRTNGCSTDHTAASCTNSRPTDHTATSRESCHSTASGSTDDTAARIESDRTPAGLSNDTSAGSGNCHYPTCSRSITFRSAIPYNTAQFV